ncbi:MAG: hypothetical protein ACR2P8_11915 [Myxococcota bacterium]
MKKLFVLTTAAIAVLGWVGSAADAPINWEGTSVVQLGDFPPAGVFGGGVATITSTDGHIGSIRLAQSRGGLLGTFTQLVTDPETISNQIFAIQYIGVGGQTGTLTPISGGLDPAVTGYNGRLPVGGLIKLCLLNTECSVTADLELTQPDPTRPGGIKGIGIGGLLTINVLSGFANISVQPQPWRIATVTLIDQIELATPDNNITFITVQRRGFAHGPSSASSTTASVTTAMTVTPGGSVTVTGRGVLQLIAPSQTLTNLTTGTSDKIASGQTFLIRFIPEPGLMLLLGSGVAGLALLGRSRMRK